MLNEQQLIIDVAKEPRVWPISIEQQSHWFLEQVDPGNSAHHLHYSFKLKGKIDRAALEQSLNQIVLRHEVLRTYFPIIDGSPCPTIRPFEPFVLEEIDGAYESPAVQGMIRSAFDLSTDRLYRFALMKQANDACALIAVFHHIVFDGWSKHVFHRELMQHYSRFVTGEGESLPPLAIQYDAFANSQAQLMSSASALEDLAYWKKKLDGEIPELHFMREPGRAEQYSLSGVAHHVSLPSALCEQLKQFGRQERATTFMLFMTALNIFLHRYTHQEDLLVGCPVSGRNKPEWESLIGVFVNTLVLRTTINGEMSARDVLRSVKAASFEAFRHQSVPFTKLVSEIVQSRGAGGKPLFQVMLNVLNIAPRNGTVAGLEMEEDANENNAAVVDLTLKVLETQGKLDCSFLYREHMFSAETISRMAGHFVSLLEALVRTPDLPIVRLNMLSDPEKRMLTYDWNRSEPAYPKDKCMHALFREQCLRNPDGVALIQGNRKMTYGELEQRSNRLAHYLLASGAGKGRTVAVRMERSMELVMSYLAILKAGGVFLPVDVSIPADRVAYMLENSRASIAIAMRSMADKLLLPEVTPIFLDKVAEAIAKMPSHCQDVPCSPDQAAYIIYTSGSTGLPKGVAVPHKGVVRLAMNESGLLLDAGQTTVHQTSISFDPSILEIFGALLNGGKVLITEEGRSSLAELGREIRKHGGTIFCTVPDMLNQLLETCGADLQSLRQVLCGGDFMPVWLTRKFRKVLPDCQLINIYGPTENSIATTYHIVKEVEDELSVPIGRPIAGDRVYILDSLFQPVPIGVAGELYLAGDGVALGYVGNERLTEQRFVPDPYGGGTGARMYATGDLARFRADCNIEFLGRQDHQVKIRGCRIELGEVEAIIDRHPDIRQSIARAWKNDAGSYQLLCYVVMEPGARFDRDRLRHDMQGSMPPYMVPSYLIEMTAFPMTPFGKIDRKALPDPDRASSDEARVMPRSDVERRLHAIWTELLGTDSFGVTNSFFHVGGHSLLALRLFTEIERCFGKKLPVSLIYQEDTVERLARLLITDDEGFHVSSLVGIQPQGSQLPVFCIHDVNGEVLTYRHLVSELGQDQPVFGLRDTRDLGAKTSIPGYAAKYIQEIRKQQPVGPYRLVGYSLGGLIAYEMAQQLLKAGEEIELLAIVDTRSPKLARPSNGLRDKAHQMANAIHGLPFRRKAGFAMQILRRLLIKAGLMSFSPEELKERRESGYILSAIAAYDPEPYPGKIVLFQAEHKSDKRHGWEVTETGSIDIHRIASDHALILDKPNAKRIANTLKLGMDVRMGRI